jgi:hypothetical protein
MSLRIVERERERTADVILGGLKKKKKAIKKFKLVLVFYLFIIYLFFEKPRILILILKITSIFNFYKCKKISSSFFKINFIYFLLIFQMITVLLK